MRVLYATDGSAAARQAELMIPALFDPTSARIDVMTVTPEQVLLEPVADSNYELVRLDVPPFDPQQIAEASAERLDAEGFAAGSIAERGNPAIEILRKLDSRYDLVLLGASHTSWIGNTLLGSVSMHVLHQAPCSVMVVHRAPLGSGTVLIADDGSASAAGALASAMRLLDPEKCSLSIVTVIADPWLTTAMYPPMAGPIGYRLRPEQQKRQVERAWQIVERSESRALAAGFKAESAVLTGSAVPQLLKEAENLRADLIVAGSRGLGPVRRAYLGSVSDQLVRHSAATFVGRSSP